MRFDPTAPFALLDDARHGCAKLYTGGDIISAVALADVLPALDSARAALRAGRHLAGFMAYEAGHALVPRRAAAPRLLGEPLVWLLAGPPPRLFDSRQVDALLDVGPAVCGLAAPELAEADYRAAAARVAGLIAAGDIYQANLTFGAGVAVHGHPLALYRRLRRTAQMPHGALLFTGEHYVLSLSPERFFALNSDGVLVAQPMKGTAPRDPDPAADAEAARTLATDPKNRAENLMITDLIRNDLSRVSVPGSVRVPSLFAVESYPTVHQLVSTVTAQLAPGLDAVDVLRAMFPCGSVTGAPKRRAMEVIGELEAQPRGLYCGSIGAMHPDGRADWNVAIRTVTIARGATAGRLGLGSGLVADSDAQDEWRECLLKGAFLTASRPSALIETMRVEGGRIGLLARHMERLARSAAWFGFACDHGRIRDAVARAVSGERAPMRARLLLSDSGAWNLAMTPLPVVAPLTALAVPLADPADWRLRHKTTSREPYAAALAAARAAGANEAVLVRGDGLVTEGSYTSLFVERDGLLLTPPARLGLLPGVLRAELLASGRAREAELTPADLAHGFMLGNAVRGLVPARLLDSGHPATSAA